MQDLENWILIQLLTNVFCIWFYNVGKNCFFISFSKFSDPPTNFCPDHLVPLTNKDSWIVSSLNIKFEDSGFFGTQFLNDDDTYGWYYSSEGDSRGDWIQVRALSAKITFVFIQKHMYALQSLRVL